MDPIICIRLCYTLVILNKLLVSMHCLNSIKVKTVVIIACKICVHNQKSIVCKIKNKIVNNVRSFFAVCKQINTFSIRLMRPIQSNNAQ